MCTPIAQIAIGILVPVTVIALGVVAFLRHRKSKTLPIKADNDGVALVVFTRPPALGSPEGDGDGDEEYSIG